MVRLVGDALKEFIMVVYLIASRTGAENPLSYLLCEARALKIRLYLRMIRINMKFEINMPSYVWGRNGSHGLTEAISL